MKKSILTLLCTALALSLASCGAAETETETTAESAQTAAAEVTEAETETSAETATTSEETTTTVTETEKVCNCESEFQHACCEYLNGMNELGGGVYYGDINDDDRSEAVISKWASDKDTIILYYKKNELGEMLLDTESDWGKIRYIADTKQILFSPFYGHTTGTWGYEEYYLYGWKGTDYEIVTSIFRESGSYELSELGQAYIDGKEVDNDTFEIKLDEIQKLIDENEYFPVIKPDDENFESYMKENFPCFDNWDIVYYNKN